MVVNRHVEYSDKQPQKIDRCRIVVFGRAERTDPGGRLRFWPVRVKPQYQTKVLTAGNRKRRTDPSARNDILILIPFRKFKDRAIRPHDGEGKTELTGEFTIKTFQENTFYEIRQQTCIKTFQEHLL